MTDLYFDSYKDGSEGRMARMYTMEEGMPLNIHLQPGSDMNLKKDTVCSVDIYADECEFSWFESEEEYLESGQLMAPQALLPAGTFDETPDGKPVQESPFVLFSGEVTDLEEKPQYDENDPPDYLATVKCYGITIKMYLWCDDVQIEKGFILTGTAWLFGVVKASQETSD